ncbi:MAG: cupin-like domain-containing protein [Kineosporiaceae bacterium]|nr:cupin-like domain-containing protein [Kineosporiaceae bacterium]
MSRFTRGGGVGAAVADQVDDAALARLYAEGHTLVLQGLHRIHPPVITFAQALSLDLGHPVQVNAYVTPRQSQGFSDHYDVHDVFVVQTAGRKRWMIRPPVHAHPLRDQPWTDHREAVEDAASREPLLDVVLEPGDVLYLPAGFLHAAQALGETSAHLTVGVHTWTRFHLIEQLVHRLGEVAELRAPLPLGVDVTDPAAISRELDQLRPVLDRALRDLDADALVDGLRERARDGVRPEPVAPLAQTALLDVLTEDWPLRLRRNLGARRHRTAGGWVLSTADGDHELPADLPEPISDAVGRLVDGHVVRAGELGLELAARWVRAALVVTG